MPRKSEPPSEPTFPEGVAALLWVEFEAISAPGGDRPAWSDAEALVDSVRRTHHGVAARGPEPGSLLVFVHPRDAVACAWELRTALANENPFRTGLSDFRMALHAAEIERGEDGHPSGPPLRASAQLCARARPGQVLLSRVACGLVNEALPPGTRLREHRLHPLHDRSQAEPLFELVGEGEAERGLATGATGLPGEHSSLIGRERTCETVRERIEESRVVTLVGAGGSGKTRIALRLAHEHAERAAEAVHWVDLAALRDPALVATAVAAATGASDLSESQPLAALEEQFAPQRAWLVLDNCEHLLEACAALVSALRSRCPRLQVLATSRERLGIDGEAVFEVPPLALPPESDDPARVGAAPAAQLLVERADRARAGFRLTQENARAISGICRKLDGLPLALELAAARLRVLSPQQVLLGLSERFRLLKDAPRGAPERQRTLEASVAWSFDLLGDDERKGMRRLAVFPGSFDLAAAEAVCADADLDAYAVLDLLARLVDRSLVGVETRGGSRYVLTETIRAYTQSRLGEDDDLAAIRSRHLEHFARVAQALQPGLDAAEPRPVLEQLDSELPNLRAALDWAAESGAAGLAIAMIESSQRYWAMRGLQPEMYERLEAVLAAPGLADPLRARGNITGAEFAARTGRFGVAMRFAAPALELARAGDDREIRCDALTAWSYPAFQSGAATSSACLAALDEACALAEALGDPLRLWQALGYRGVIRSTAASANDGIADLERAFALAQQIGSPPLVAIARVFLAALYRFVLRVDEAREQASRAIEESQGVVVGAPVAMAEALLAAIEMTCGQLDSAAEHLTRAHESAFVAGRRLGAEVWGDPEVESAELAYRRGELSEARRLIEGAIEAFQERGYATHRHVSGVLAAALALEAGDRDAARQRLEEAASFARSIEFTGLVGWSELGLASVSREAGAQEQAWSQAHEALACFTRCELSALTALAIELVAALALERDRAEFGARMLGAADAALAAAPGWRRPIEARSCAEAHEAARAALGAERFEGLFAEGRGLALEEAAEIARRSRGERSRPRIGWDSLTPTEREVARLVAEGHRNAAIAKQLFVSVSTVKTHLTRTYAKLGMASRAELASEVTRRSTEG